MNSKEVSNEYDNMQGLTTTIRNEDTKNKTFYLSNEIPWQNMVNTVSYLVDIKLMIKNKYNKKLFIRQVHRLHSYH